MDTLLRYPHPREIELKLEIASGHADALLAHPLLALARPLPEESGNLHATYFDTPDHILRRAGLTLRIRRKNARLIQTIKAESGPRGLALDRGEWERPVENGIDLAAATGTPLAPILTEDGTRERIAPVFTIETDRRAFLIVRDEAVIEIALDQAKISAASRHHSFCEVELELKKGDPSHLFAVACELAETIPLRLSPFTKSDRGYDLIDDMTARPVTAEAIDLPSSTSCAEAFAIIARSCLSQIVRNEALFRRTKDAEALHQLRIGFRRLQAATSLFKPMLLDRESRNVKDRLRWAGRQLGPARDLDVLIGSVHKPADVGAHAAELRRAEKKRAKAYDTLLNTLSSPRFMRTILRTAAWIEAGRWRTRDKRGVSQMRERLIRDYAPGELARRWKPIRKRLKQVAILEAEDRHALRLRIKKLRYISEFLEGLFLDLSKKPDRSWLTTFKRLQDILGELNDIVVGSSILPALAQSDPERARRRKKKLLSQAEASARTLRKSDPFWV
ncbi:CYTH and CHAD domain-containing protein [Microvirga solisilvae]|uniref:CYTH and CHAD domain-containing protein n=1 Tax=Microvirga solisilvae TaxID=2919498 RepID=UPI001FAEE4EE|nr:CYTH and CHAD domain-containing protein [Microvirga solisilvae]